jgi:hypothetical protein
MNIEWELTGNDPSDLKADVEDGMLRVEQMDKGVWWFAVFHGSESYMSGELFPFVDNKDTAKQMAEGVYRLLKNGKPTR